MPVQRHKTAVRTCQIHVDAPMYFYVCSCGLHSQCWPDRATTNQLARLHANPPIEPVT